MLQRLLSGKAMQTWLLIGIGVLLVVLVIAGPELLRWLPARVAQYRAKHVTRWRRGPREQASTDDLDR